MNGTSRKLAQRRPLTDHLFESLERADLQNEAKSCLDYSRLHARATWGDVASQIEHDAGTDGLTNPTTAAAAALDTENAIADHFLRTVAHATTDIERFVRQYSAPLVAVVCGRIYTAMWTAIQANPFDVTVDLTLSADSVDAELRKASPELFATHWAKGRTRVAGPRVTGSALRAAVNNAAKILADEIAVSLVADANGNTNPDAVCVHIDLSAIFVLYQPLTAMEKSATGGVDAGTDERLTEDELRDLENAESLNSSVGSDAADLTAAEGEEATASDMDFLASDDDDDDYDAAAEEDHRGLLRRSLHGHNSGGHRGKKESRTHKHRESIGDPAAAVSKTEKRKSSRADKKSSPSTAAAVKTAPPPIVSGGANAIPGARKSASSSSDDSDGAANGAERATRSGFDDVLLELCGGAGATLKMNAKADGRDHTMLAKSTKASTKAIATVAGADVEGKTVVEDARSEKKKRKRDKKKSKKDKRENRG
eukprot:Opistho-2@304